MDNRCEIKILPTGEMVKKYQIIGTNVWVYNAWTLGQVGSGSTICFENDKWWGRIGTDPDRSSFQSLKLGTFQRSEAVQRAYNKRFEVAYKLIFQAFPELKTMLHTDEASRVHTDRGEIEVWEK